MHSTKKLKFTCGITLFFFLWTTIFPYQAIADHAFPWYTGGTPIGGQMTSTGEPVNSEAPQSPPANGCYRADPVYLHSGEFFYTCQDLLIPGRGMDVEIKHLYQSGKNYNGHYGVGWTINYQERLVRLNNGNIAVINGEGRKVEHVYIVGANTYVPPPGFLETLNSNPDGTWTLTRAHGEKSNYDINGNLSSIVDRNGNQITFQYDAGGLLPVIGKAQFTLTPLARVTIGYDYRLRKIIDTLGRAIDFTYNADGRLARITDFAGRVVEYSYDPYSDDLLTIKKPVTPQFPSGITKTFTYDTAHNLKTITDGKGQTFVTNFYDGTGKVSRQDLGAGTFYFTYEKILSYDTARVTDPNGNVTDYSCNATGNPLAVHTFTKGLRVGEPVRFSTTYNYNANMLKTLVRYPAGNSIKYVYDETNPDLKKRGNILTIRRRFTISDTVYDFITSFTYEPNFNQVKTMTDPLGRVYTLTYDYELPAGDPRFGTKGNAVTIKYPTVGGVIPQIDFTYNTFGQVTQVKDPNGNLTNYTYSPITGLLTQIARDPSGINSVTQFTYDSFLNLDTTIDPNNHTTDYAYNALGWLIDETNPLGFKTKYTYDANANVTKVERQMNAQATTWQTTQLTYDVLNHVKTVVDPLNRATTYNYDLNENLASIVDARNFTTTYTYDERDLLFKVTDANAPSAGVTRYDYTPNGNLANVTDANGNATTYTYDTFDRLTRTTYPNALFSQYDYNKNSNVIRHTTPSTKVIEYDYDTLNRLTATRYLSTATLNKTFTYDAGSRLLTANTSAANNTFTYDALNRLKTNPQTLNGSAYTLSYTYDKENLTKTTYPSGKVVDYVYDNNDRLTNLKVNAVTLSNYTYDLLDRRATRDLVGTATQRSTYTFDNANQLTNLLNVRVGGATISQYGYTYDNVGNRLTMTAPNGTHTYTYNNIEELTTVTGAQTRSFAYDKVANRTTVDGVAYTKNNLNQYTQVGAALYSYDTNGNLTTDGVNTYTYDEENRLATFSKAGTTASYTYDAFNRRVSKIVNGVTTFYVYDGDEDIEERASTGTLSADYVYGDNLDEVLTMKRGATTYYYQYDGLGSVTRLTNAAGATVESYNYDVYGQPSITSTVGNPFFFTGRRLDSESGVYYYRARMYDPKIGRFLQRDPIGYYDSMNLYVYVNNNPLNWLDPLGLCDQPDKNKDSSDDFWKKFKDFGTQDGDLYKQAWERWKQEGFWKDPFYSVGGRVFGPFSPKGLPRWLQRPRQYFRLDPPHHGKGWHFDGDIFKWFRKSIK